MTERRTKHVRMREKVGDAILYQNADGLEAYLKALFEQLPLDTNMFEMISDFAQHRLALAKALTEVTDASPSDTVLRGLQAVPNARSRLLNYIMQCYFVAHRRAAALSGDGIVEAARHMWSLLMHAYLDAARRETAEARDATATLLSAPSDTLRFCVAASTRGSPISVSDDPVQLFSVMVHWRALSSATGALYAFPYSTYMYDYVRVLTLRHAQLLAGEIDDPDDLEELDDVFDHPLYCAGDVGRPYLRAARSGAVLLNDRYLGDTETLLGAQLVRLTRVRWFIETALQRSPMPRPRLDTGVTYKPWADAIRAFVDNLALHDILRTFVVDEVTKKLIGTLLMHGETARFSRAHPRQEPVPDNVLATMRHNAYKTVAVLSTRPVADFIRAALEATFAAEAEEPIDWTARVRPEHEPAAILVLTEATNVWLQYQGVSPTFVKDRLHIEELRVGVDELAPVFDVPVLRPCFIRCMRWNFVVLENGRFAYAGTNLVAAYATWIRALFEACPDNGRGAKLTEKAIHTAWQPLLSDALTKAAAPVTPHAPASTVTFI